MIANMVGKRGVRPMSPHPTNIDDFDDIDFIRMILMQEYHLTEEQADDAIKISRVQTFFQKNPDMAGHDSHRQWAEYVYKCRKTNQEKKAKIYYAKTKVQQKRLRGAIRFKPLDRD